MPFRSKAQRRWMHARKPEMAERWEKETPSTASLPEHAAKKGKIKKADFPSSMGPEDWDAIGASPWKQGEPKLTKDKAMDDKKEKVSGEDAYLDGDGSYLMPDLRRIHKLGHVVPVEKLAQGEFEYADLGPNAGEMGPRVSWKMPGKIKNSAGLDQEENLDDPQRGTEPPAAFVQPDDIRLRQLARKQGPIKKIARASYVAFLDELNKLAAEDLSPKEKRREFWRFIRKAGPAVGALGGAAAGIHSGLKGGKLSSKVLEGVGTGTLVGSIPELLGGSLDAWKRFREKTQ